MPIEIYAVIGKPVYLIHQRSLCKKGKKFPFCREFLALIESMCPLPEGIDSPPSTLSIPQISFSHFLTHPLPIITLR